MRSSECVCANVFAQIGVIFTPPVYTGAPSSRDTPRRSVRFETTQEVSNLLLLCSFVSQQERVRVHLVVTFVIPVLLGSMLSTDLPVTSIECFVSESS